MIKELNDNMTCYIDQNDVLMRHHIEQIKIVRLQNNNIKAYADQNKEIINNFQFAVESLKNLLDINAAL